MVGRDVHPLQSNQPDEANYDETRKKLCEISYMILDVYNAVGEYERPPCKCEDYQQELRLLRQKLHGTLEANRILSTDNEKLRLRVEHHRRPPRRAHGAGGRGNDDLYARMKEIEASFQQIIQDRTRPLPSPPPPPPPPPP
ncbi:hypothetical protein EV126DRAFT_413132, partial [Verticillium dahliae]